MQHPIASRMERMAPPRIRKVNEKALAMEWAGKIVTPNNPTGGVLKEDVLTMLSALVQDHSLMVIADTLVNVVQDLTETMYKITGIVMKFSPIGVAALLAESVGEYGLSIFGLLGKLILTVYVSDVILVLFMYAPIVAILACFSLKTFFRTLGRHCQHHQQQRFSSCHYLHYQ